MLLSSYIPTFRPTWLFSPNLKAIELAREMNDKKPLYLHCTLSDVWKMLTTSGSKGVGAQTVADIWFFYAQNANFSFISSLATPRMQYE